MADEGQTRGGHDDLHGRHEQFAMALQHSGLLVQDEDLDVLVPAAYANGRTSASAMAAPEVRRS